MDCKSMDWFLYDNGPRHERVKKNALTFCLRKVFIKCRISISKSSVKTLQYSRRIIIEKKNPLYVIF